MDLGHTRQVGPLWHAGEATVMTLLLDVATNTIVVGGGGGEIAFIANGNLH